MPKLGHSSSVPTLPPATGRTDSSRSTSHAKLAPGETVEKLAAENELLRQQLYREKQNFQTMYVKDLFKSPARRRLEPMRQLVIDQSEASSQLATEKLTKQQQMDLVEARAKTDAVVHERRLQDVTTAEMRLQQLEEQLAMADGDAADACDREDTYSMMEARLQNLVTEDQGRLNTIQRVIDESKLRLQQWLNVSKEGEGELNAAEAALAELRSTLREERTSQRKMLSERRTMVDSMVKYAQERKERQSYHQDKLLASRGDLDAEGEQQLRTAAGTIDALRAINEPAAKAAITFEDKCKRAFLKIEGLTGAKDLTEVLFIVTSKSELATQLQRRVAGIQERRTELEEEKLRAEEECTKEQYGVSDEGDLKEQIAELRERLAAQEQRLRERSSALTSTMAMLQSSRLTWENVHKLLEPGKEVEDPRARRRREASSSAQAAAIDRLLAAEGAPSTAGGSTQQTPQQGARRGGASRAGSAVSGAEGDVDLSLLPREIGELPAMVEEVGQRGAKVLEMVATIEAHAAAAAARRRAALAAGESEDDAAEAASPGGVSSILSLAKQRSASGKGYGGEGGEPSAAPLTRDRSSSKNVARERTISKEAALLSEALPSNNIRVMPADLAEALLQAREETPADDPTGKRPSAAAKAAAAEKEAKDKEPGRRTSFQMQTVDDDTELVSREDMKAAAMRLARKAARASLKGSRESTAGSGSGGDSFKPAPSSKGKGRSK